jgi:hypothetical protein
VLIILTLTAVVISYQWAGNLVYTLTGNEVPQQQAPQATAPNQTVEQPFAVPENLDEIWTKAENHTNWKTISLRLPLVRESAVFTIDEGIYWNIFGRSSLTIDAKTAEIAKWEPYGEQNSGRRLRSWIRFTHTGETGGIVGNSSAFSPASAARFLFGRDFHFRGGVSADGMRNHSLKLCPMIFDFKLKESFKLRRFISL